MSKLLHKGFQLLSIDFVPLKIKTLLWILAICSLQTLAQGVDYNFHLYSFEDGLTHRNVFKIQQDKNGFIWMATINGLNKFDGHQFIHFTSNSQENSIPHDYVTDILIDENNQLWMASGEGLTIFNVDDFSNQTVLDFEHHESVMESNHRLYNLFHTSTGNVAFTSFHEETGSSYVQYKSSDQLITIEEANGEYSYHPIAEFDGNLVYAPDNNRLRSKKLQEDTPPITSHTFNTYGSSPDFSRVIDLQRVDDKLYALLDNAQVYYRTVSDPEFKRHPITNYLFASGESTSFYVKENGDMWVAGMNRLWFYNEKDKSISNFNDELNGIFDHAATLRQIYEDQTGVLWIATDFGALKISRSESLFSNYLNGGNEFCNDGFCSTRGITEDEDGNIYISYYNSIHVLKKNSNRIEPLFNRNQTIDNPFDILYHNDALWTGSGLRIDLNNGQIDTIINNKELEEGVIMLDKDEDLWFGCKNKLCRYNVSEEILDPYRDQNQIIDTLEFNNITFLYQGKYGDFIWIGTKENGLYQISKETGGVAKHTLSSPRVLVVEEDDLQNLWVGTAEGINKLNIPSSTLEVYTTEDGLSNNFINGLLVESDSVIWVSTDHGLSRFNAFSKIFDNFYEKDGLSKNEFNRMSSFKARDGRMFFGGLNGVNAFYPSVEFENKKLRVSKAQLVFTSFSRYDGRNEMLVSRQGFLDNQDTIRLSHTDEFFNFGFALADFSEPRNRLYSYKLDGYETSWSEPSNQNVARFNNIPAGKYTLRVRASTGNGEWNPEELSAFLIIKEAFYKQNWFFISLVLLAMGLVYSISRYRIYSLEKHEKELEELVNARTKELELEKQKSEELLLNILPTGIAEELKQFGTAKAKRHDCVTVLFSDFKNFVKIASKMEPEELVAEVHYCFKAFDEIVERYGLEKIKTIGDAYMCVGGISCSDSDAAVRIVKAAFEIQAFLGAVALERSEQNHPYFEARIGIHTGPVVAGIVGIKKFAYDIWGDTVNIAARMEETSEPGKVNVSETTFQLIKDQFECLHRGKIFAKNKGEIDMYFVENVKEPV